MSKVLITGGTGLVGVYLTNKLKIEGFKVNILSRNPKKDNEYKWDLNQNYIDEKALIGVDYIIHLAGAGVVDKRWTAERKEMLISSRVKSAKLLFDKVQELNIDLKGFISASGIGYYGAVTSEKVFTEEDASENDFISKICIEWEAAAKQFERINIPVTILRIGVVLTKDGGALQKMNTPLFLSAIGSGKQYMPWIHIEDVASLFIKALKDSSFKGVFNAIAPSDETNKSFTKTLGSVIKKAVLPIGVPAFVLKLVLGELSILLLTGSRVSAEKTTKYYQFKYKTLQEALTEIYNKK